MSTDEKLSLWRRALLLIGIETGPRRGWRAHIRPRFFLLLLGIVALGFVGLVGFAAYSTSPSFCKSCHIMQPYYDAWATSKHSMVPCVDCHYPASTPRTLLWKKFQAMSQVAKYVTRTYSSKPFAEVDDSSCLRKGCHSTRLLQGRVVSAKGVLFDHRPHLEGVRYGRQLRCVSCHSQIAIGRHIEVAWDTCYLCHLKDRTSGRKIEPLGGCQGCHLLPDREIKVQNVTYNHKEFLAQHPVACESCHQDVVQGTGEVTQDRCFTCHNEPKKLERIGDIQFLHQNHVTKHNTACFHCHRELRHVVTAAGTKKLNYDCTLCHTDMHDLQREFYRGVGAKGVPPMPSPMYLSNVDCVGCHLEKKQTEVDVGEATTYVGNEKGCVDCHGQAYLGILPETQKLVDETAAKLEAKLEELKKATATATDPALSREANDAVHDATFNLRFIIKSRGVHNIYYAAQILRATDASLTGVAEKLKAKVDDLSELPVISGAFCATMCHGKVGVKVPAETVKFRGKDMPHKQHIDDGQACNVCHTFGVHKDVKLKPIAVCKQCHEDMQEDPEPEKVEDK